MSEAWSLSTYKTGILKHGSREFTNLTLFRQLSFSEIDVYAAESIDQYISLFDVHPNPLHHILTISFG